MRGKWLHRKLWERCAVAQALEERDMLRPGRKGIGFAVGQEPLPSIFAAHGVHLVASHFHFEGVTRSLGHNRPTRRLTQGYSLAQGAVRSRFRSAGHVRDHRHARSERSSSRSLRFRLEFVLIRTPWHSRGWSTFLVDSLESLKPAGVAVHTTEFNVSSNDATVESSANVIYRRKHIEAFDARLRGMECGIEALNTDPGHDQHDVAYDFCALVWARPAAS